MCDVDPSTLKMQSWTALFNSLLNYLRLFRTLFYVDPCEDEIPTEASRGARESEKQSAEGHCRPAGIVSLECWRFLFCMFVLILSWESIYCFNVIPSIKIQ